MTQTQPPAARVERGFTLTCLACGQEASISLDLDTLDTFRCPECENDFSRETVEEVIGQWRKVLDWIDLAPAKE
jgi:hypothetical protein